MDHTAFDELKTTGKLPSPSGVALKIMELCRRDDVTIQELARVLQADPALSGRLIKFANSAMAGPRRPVAAVTDAIRLLGIGTVRQLALGFSVLGHHRTGACGGFDYDAFWSASLASAIGAHSLCLRTRTAPADEAFTCGLLLRVGELALATVHPDRYGACLQQVKGLPPAAVAERERELFHTDHAELGAALLEDWMLPRIFVTAVSHHEAPSSSGFPEGSRESVLCLLLHLARKLGLYCVAGDAERRTMVPDLVFDGARVGIDADALALVADQIVAEWRDWGRVLEVPTGELPCFSVVAQSAQAESETAVVHPPAEGAGASAIAEKLASQGLLEPLRILVVDDDPSALVVLQHVLAEQGHRVLSARDGREGLKLAVAERPQMIISDWVMPEIDGLSLCRALRETDEGRHVYFLLLTGLEKDDDLVEAFEAGVDDFVTKPFAPRVLLARLRAGHRVIRLQEEAVRDSQSLRRFATELAVANRRLRQAALTDPLTGLPNRRYAMERLEQEWASATRNQRPLALMMIDIDSFKGVNDTHGHDVGDMVLRHVALTLRKAARAEDVICRLGGEEFVLMSPDTTLRAALQMADRLRLAIGSHPFGAGTERLSVTVSIGVAERAGDMARYDELLKAADEALYRSKQLGGNRVDPMAPRAADRGGRAAV